MQRYSASGWRRPPRGMQSRSERLDSAILRDADAPLTQLQQHAGYERLPTEGTLKRSTNLAYVIEKAAGFEEIRLKLAFGLTGLLHKDIHRRRNYWKGADAPLGCRAPIL